jgi:hypothetical protein
MIGHRVARLSEDSFDAGMKSLSQLLMRILVNDGELYPDEKKKMWYVPFLALRSALFPAADLCLVFFPCSDIYRSNLRLAAGLTYLDAMTNPNITAKMPFDRDIFYRVALVMQVQSSLSILACFAAFIV